MFIIFLVIIIFFSHHPGGNVFFTVGIAPQLLLQIHVEVVVVVYEIVLMLSHFVIVFLT